MRNFIDIVEGTGQSVLASPANIAKAKTFLLKKWKERAIERGEAEPQDTSRGCKFAALFAKEIFGGKIEANDFHVWLRSGSRIIDLSEDAQDTLEMKAGHIPSYMVDYAASHDLKLPLDIYTPDEDFMETDDFIESMQANSFRVQNWVEEFNQFTITESEQYTTEHGTLYWDPLEDAWILKAHDCYAEMIGNPEEAVTLYTFSSSHSGQGNGERALRWLKEICPHIHVSDPGEEGTDSYAFWKKMFERGVIDSAEDEDNSPIDFNNA